MFDIFSEYAYLNGEIRNLKAMFDTCQTQVSTVIIHKHGSSVGGGQGIPKERVNEGGLPNHPVPQHHTAEHLSLARVHHCFHLKRAKKESCRHKSQEHVIIS